MVDTMTTFTHCRSLLVPGLLTRPELHNGLQTGSTRDAVSTSCDGLSTQKRSTVIRLDAPALFLRAFSFGQIGKRRDIFSRFAVSFVIAACAVALSHAPAWAGPATHFDVTPTFVLARTQATFTITALDSSNNIDPAPRTVIVEYPQDLPGTFQPTSVDLTYGTGAFLGTLKVGNHLIILVDKDNPNFTTFFLLTGS
jgi:hypothetical protein